MISSQINLGAKDNARLTARELMLKYNPEFYAYIGSGDFLITQFNKEITENSIIN